MTNIPQWRLRNPHYLNVPGTEWEHTETNRETGRKGRKVFHVPALLSPEDPGDCNREGDCIVYHTIDGENASFAGRQGYHEFLGDPTPEMEPMNDAAEAISATFADRWQHPIDSLAPNYSQSLLGDLEAALANAINKAGGIPTVTAAVPSDEVAALKAQVAELTALVMAQTTPAETTAPTPIRR